MNITHSPILYQGGGTAMLAHTQPSDWSGTARHVAPYTGKEASNVPSEHDIEGEVLRPSKQASPQEFDRRAPGGTYHGESWTAAHPSAQRAISMYQYHAQAHRHPTQHLIDIYA